MGWRFLTDREEVWSKFLEYRYDGGLKELCGFVSKRMLLKVSLWWRDVRQVCGAEVIVQHWFSNFLS